jgi:hypothetical protein
VRRVRNQLRQPQADVSEVRRTHPNGWQFCVDWVTRLEVARGAAAGVEYMWVLCAAAEQLGGGVEYTWVPLCLAGCLYGWVAACASQALFPPPPCPLGRAGTSTMSSTAT